MLAVPATELPEPGPAWAAEFKWDGVRAVAYLSAGRLRLLSRSGRDMTQAYPELTDLALQAGSREMVLDGEIAAFAGGRPSFAALQRRMHVAAPSPRLLAAVPATYLVFDIMDLGGESLISEPYVRRRDILEAQHLAGEQVHVPPSFPGAGKAVLAVSIRDGLEGVVAKRLDSPYRPGRRSPDWLKIKNRRILDVLVGGISPGRGHRAGQIGSLLVGIARPGGLAYSPRRLLPEHRRLQRPRRGDVNAQRPGGPNTSVPPASGPSSSVPPSSGPSSSVPPSSAPTTSVPPGSGPSSSVPPDSEPSTPSPGSLGGLESLAMSPSSTVACSGSCPA